MNRKLLIATLASVLLLPASCALGVTASRMQGVRLGTAPGEGDPLWVENMLWIGALALMLLWARQIKRIYRPDAGTPAPKEIIE